MFNKIVADRYARALLISCPDLATIEKVQDDLDILGKTYDSSPETRAFLLNPKMPSSIKKQILESALANRIAAPVMNLLLLLIEKDRQKIIPEIADRFNELTDQVRGVEKAVVITAVDISSETRSRLLESIQRFSSRNVEVTFMTDPSIIGGVIIRLGDKVIDGSLKYRFSEMRRKMLAAQLPGTTS